MHNPLPPRRPPARPNIWPRCRVCIPRPDIWPRAHSPGLGDLDFVFFIADFWRSPRSFITRGVPNLHQLLYLSATQCTILASAHFPNAYSETGGPPLKERGQRAILDPRPPPAREEARERILVSVLRGD